MTEHARTYYNLIFYCFVLVRKSSFCSGDESLMVCIGIGKKKTRNSDQPTNIMSHMVIKNLHLNRKQQQIG